MHRDQVRRIGQELRERLRAHRPQSRTGSGYLDVAWVRLRIRQPSFRNPPRLRQPKRSSRTTIDPLGRETPRSAMMGFLKYAERARLRERRSLPAADTGARHEFGTASQGTSSVAAKFKRQHLFVERRSRTAQLKRDFRLAKYALEFWTVGGTTVDVILVRVDDPASGKIWLISKETVARIPRALCPNGTRRRRR